MANTTIGFLTCPIMGDKAEVRRDKKRKLYYVGLAGKMTPNLTDGQTWINKVTEFINGNGEPLPSVEKPVNEKTEQKTEQETEQKTVNENKPKKSGVLGFLFENE